MIVLIADKFEKAGVEGIKSLGCTTVYEPDLGTEKLPEALERNKPTVLVVRSTKVPAPVVTVAAASGVKVIIRAGAGVDNIDVAAATKAGVKVCNCPGMNAVAVAEVAMGLLISCDRRIPDQCAELKAGRWDKKGFGKAKGLKGLTLGVVGVGSIGAEMIKRAKAFDMKVVAWSRSLTPEKAAAMGVEFGGTDKAALLKLAARSDAISVHVAATPDTKKLCDKAFFDAMKPGAYFVNTSRGSTVDEAALREAVAAKGIRAGLDVYENQPAEAQGAFETPTSKVPGIYTTHHCGASTDQAQNAVADETVRIVKVYMETGKVENCVNP